MTSYKLSAEAKTRIETMVATTDGFEIAEVDLKLRGPGDMMGGTRQSGVLALRVADIVKDNDILAVARNTAIELLQKDATLALPEHESIKKVLQFLQSKKGLWKYIS